MGVTADTATAVVDKWPDIPGEANGFTGGDPQAGIAPTQLDPEYFNAVTEEINAYIAEYGGLTPAFDAGARRQMSNAAYTRLYDGLGSDYKGDAVWTRRTFPASNSSAESDWRVRLRNGFAKNVADNTITNVCLVNFPNSTRAILEFFVEVVKVTDIDTFQVVKLIASVKRSSGGVASIQDFDVVYTQGGLVANIDVIATGGSVAVQVSIAPDAGAHFNIHADVIASNVTTSIA